jgi:hypothetical protein
MADRIYKHPTTYNIKVASSYYNNVLCIREETMYKRVLNHVLPFSEALPDAKK